MGYKQVKTFDPNKMGSEKGMCLRNVAKGYGIYPSPSPSSSAKNDMERNAQKGTLHRDRNFPANCAVPVYLDTSSPYEHVIVADHGIYWSDKKRLTTLDGLSVIGWGEWCNGYQIVSYTPDPTPPTPTGGFLPAKGYWGRYDNDPRVAQLASFMRAVFPAYTPASALGPVYGDNLWGAIKQFQQRAKAAGRYNDVIDGNTGPKTYAALKTYGFKG